MEQVARVWGRAPGQSMVSPVEVGRPEVSTLEAPETDGTVPRVCVQRPETDLFPTQDFTLFGPQRAGRGHHTRGGGSVGSLTPNTAMDRPRVTFHMSGCLVTRPRDPRSGHCPALCPRPRSAVGA